ncbi:MAG: hypothetical protein KDA92_26445, partial [Planctomycetales bacterium]|nr:hypothetical protein [Planctomycetales bacterium]
DKAEQELKSAIEAADKDGAERQAAETKVAESKAAVEAAEKTLAAAAGDEEKQAAQAELDKSKQALTAAENELKPKAEAAQKSENQRNEKQQTRDAAVRSVETSEQALADARQDIERLTPLLTAAQEAFKVAEGVANEQTAAASGYKAVAIGAAASPSGQQFATVAADGTVSVWRSETGQPVEQFSLDGQLVSPCRMVDFLTDELLQLVGTDGRITRVNLNRQWQLVRTIGAPDDTSTLQDRVTALAFSPDSAILAVGGGQPSRSGELDLYRVADGTLIREIEDSHSDTIFGVAFSPDGKLLASCGADRFMKVFDVASGAHVRTFEGHTHHVLSVAWRADGRVLATASADKGVKLWNLSDGSQLRTIQGFGKEVTSLQFSGATDVFYAACGDQNVYRCDVGGNRKSIGRGNDFLYVVAVDQLGRSIVFGGHDSILRTVDPEGKQLVELAPTKP